MIPENLWTQHRDSKKHDWDKMVVLYQSSSVYFFKLPEFLALRRKPIKPNKADANIKAAEKE